jgi:uncharacterized protein YfaS (alpha-2-macroglobulin family)
MDFSIDASPQHHSYTVYWTLTVHAVNRKGEAVSNAEVKILDAKGEETWAGKTDSSGRVQAELEEYSVDGEDISMHSPYLVYINKKKQEVSLDSNKEITVKVR